MNVMTNNSDLSLCMSVWLAHDDYANGADQFPGKNVISATSLLKPTRQLVLGNRVPMKERTVDVSDMIPSQLGRAIHDSIEGAWTHGYQEAMLKLGYTQKVIDRVRINPETVEDGDLPVYLEQRFFKSITVDGVEIIISGKFDQIIMGELNDTKTTSVYAYINRSKEEDYRIQGSIYRWISQDKVTSDIMRIQHVFTDWQRSMARASRDYPQERVVEFKVEMMNIKETENWMRLKVREIIANQNLPEPEVIRCSDKDLWKSDPQYKFYADPAKATQGGRSTKNFANYPAAAAHRNKAGKGVVITVPGQVKACGYCPGFTECTQKDEYPENDRS